MGLPARAQDLFLGVTATAGLPMGFNWAPEFRDSGFGVNLKAGADFAYRLSDGFAIGAYTTIGSGPIVFKQVDKGIGIINRELKAAFDWKVGLLMLVGDVNGNPFIIGFTPCTGYGVCVPVEYVPLELRFGTTIYGNFYLTGNLNFGVPINTRNYAGQFFFVEPSVTVGYNLSSLIRR